LLRLRAEASADSAAAGALPQGIQVEILERQGNVISPDDLQQSNIVTELWFQIRSEDAEGNVVEGWSPESRVRVREEDESGRPLAGTIRPKLASGADPLTDLYLEPSVRSDLAGRLEPRAEVEILDQTTLELWYRIRGSTEQGGSEQNAVEGWAPSRYIRILGNEETGRIDRGNAGEFTSKYLLRMVRDRFFQPALWTTLLLMVLIIPVQFVLAIVMALVIQAQLPGNSFFLYVFAIALGVSDLAVGILWFAVFTQNGFLNTILQALGVIDAPVAYLTAQTRYWIIVAIWLAEVWRATSLVMVIVVAGLQAIPGEVLEAAELFGAGLWQRVRFVILPMLRPSLQVALILRTILALQVFAVVIALGGGDVVTVLANESYRQYIELRNPNVAAAYSGFILLLSMITSIFYLRAVRVQEESVE
jgi:multiple sugar transport system permease protein